jgi:hypothetical protein
VEANARQKRAERELSDRRRYDAYLRGGRYDGVDIYDVAAAERELADAIDEKVAAREAVRGLVSARPCDCGRTFTSWPKEGGGVVGRCECGGWV